MVSGHVGIAFGARALDRDAPLTWLLAASLTPDVVDYALAAGRVCHPSGLYTHTLPAIGLMACIFGAASWWQTGNRRSGLVVGLMVIAHIVADYVTGLKLLWVNGPIVGLDLYSYPALDFLVELPIIVVGWWMLRRAGGVPRFITSAGTLVALLVVQAASDVTSYRKPNACVETATGTLSPAERALADAVDSHSADELALLERLVNINSGTLNFAGVRAVGDVLRAQLDSLGFKTRWVEGASFHRAGHLVAEHAGPGARLLLIGHLDTVFEPANPFQRFERMNDSTARGPGIIDMKGGDVIVVYALRALRDAGLLPQTNIAVVFDGDEEESGSPVGEARRALVDAASGATAALGFEDGAGDPHTAVISRRGWTAWTLTTSGEPGHSSQIFRKDVGAGAVFEASRILDAFYQRLSKEQYLTFNPGLALGGTLVAVDSTGTTGSASGKPNVIPERMTVTGDVRTLSPEQLARTIATMREIVARHLPLASAEISFQTTYPPMAPSAGNMRLLTAYDQVSADLATGHVAAVDPSRAGAADVSFVAGAVPMIIDGIGLSGHDDHSERETADLRMLPVMTKRAAVLILRLTQGARP
jgi:glutamate carboxypeptidase